MTAAIVASPPEPSRLSRLGPGADRAAGARTWALTRMAFRELVPVQGVIQALGGRLYYSPVLQNSQEDR